MSPISIDEAFLSSNPLPLHEEESDKQSRGRVLIVAGSREMPGAALLAACGALRAGAGILQVATCRSSAAFMGVAMPEAMVVGCEETAAGGLAPSNASRLTDLAAECDAVLIGPGMVDDEAVERLTCDIMRNAHGACFILDAAAFTTLRSNSSAPWRSATKVIVTPHAGEMANFVGRPREEIERDPLAAASTVASSLSAVVTLKGAVTYVVSDQGNAWISRNGTVGLATSGSGDVLAGIVSGLAARKTAPSLAAAWAVYMHAEAGRRLAQKYGTLGLLAREIPDEIPAIMNAHR